MQKKKNPIYIIVFLLIIIFIISLFVLAYSIKYPRRPYINNPTVTNESEYGKNIDDEIEEDDDDDEKIEEDNDEKIEDETDEEFKKLYPIYTPIYTEY